MRWPWQRAFADDQLTVSWAAQSLAYVQARATADGRFRVLRSGVEPRGQDSMEQFVARLQALGLEGANASIMLRPEQYQFLQIPAPAVPPEELRSAARYQVRDMVDIHIDDLTLDVMRVGDGQHKNAAQVFVVAATNAVVREAMAFGQTMQWPVSVIDVQETAQRNLQTAVAQMQGLTERASASLLVLDDRVAVLTISASGELFYTRRLDLPDGFMTMAWTPALASSALAEVPQAYMPVDEYVPDYAAVTPATDYLSAGADADRAQRFVVEVQRSLDLWDRSWSNMPLAGVQVYARNRTVELAEWLGRETGQNVQPMDIGALFDGEKSFLDAQSALCVPLLGLLLRGEAQ
jgi:MSHA biogenesis protein MshI